MAATPSQDIEVLQTALEHAWDWFALHAGQRMQSVNFFLIAVAFLSTAYVTALRFDYAIVVAAVGICGAVVTLCFQRLERRNRELVKAGEAAIASAERRLALLAAIPELEFINSVETPNERFTRYSSVIQALDQEVESDGDLEVKYQTIASKFSKAREAALHNTKLYLSMINDLDVYVATSMRTRQDFRAMAAACDEIFSGSRLIEMQLRYFDPTLSAAEGHEDKGLIECLMVKCAKVLVYCAGEKDSYGKDAEAAMALSLGKPAIFFCDQKRRSRFYREIHPLSRLIEFETGVAVGAMVTDNLLDVSELLYRIFENCMEYDLEQEPMRPGYLRLVERLTRSVVRLQTNDRLLTETFWNYYHNRPHPGTLGATGGPQYTY